MVLKFLGKDTVTTLSDKNGNFSVQLPVVFFTTALSRNMFFNGADRYENNASKSGNKLFSLGSPETENKLRFDMNTFKNG